MVSVNLLNPTFHRCCIPPGAPLLFLSENIPFIEQTSFFHHPRTFPRIFPSSFSSPYCPLPFFFWQRTSVILRQVRAWRLSFPFLFTSPISSSELILSLRGFPFILFVVYFCGWFTPSHRPSPFFISLFFSASSLSVLL